MSYVLRILLIMAIGALSLTANAQRGTGAATGVAQQSIVPPTVSKSGTIEKIERGPCENTTGRSLAGVHLLIQGTSGEEINLHLGPADALPDEVEQLASGQSITFDAFRTTRLPANHFIAKTVMLDDAVIRLRDDDLRPRWAGQEKGPGGGQGPGMGRNQRWGPCR